jgi:hypothetical protein
MFGLAAFAAITLTLPALTNCTWVSLCRYSLEMQLIDGLLARCFFLVSFHNRYVHIHVFSVGPFR